MIEKLSERVERLDWPSFTIEQEIGRLINPQATRLSVFPAYTASLDAAMSLVPEGCLWTMDSWSARGWSAGIWRPRTRSWLINTDRDRQSPTPAIALCAAALKSRGL